MNVRNWLRSRVAYGTLMILFVLIFLPNCWAGGPAPIFALSGLAAQADGGSTIPPVSQARADGGTLPPPDFPPARADGGTLPPPDWPPVA